MEFLRDTQIDFMKYRKVFVVVSVILAIVAILAVFVHGKLNIGVDFAGGTQLTLKFQEQPQIDIQFNIGAESVSNDVHEVTLKMTLTASSQRGTMAPQLTMVM